jgi:CheY-like chemotaxis protein
MISETLLLVDDDTKLIDGMKQGFSKLSPGRTILTASNGLEAIQVLQRCGVNLLITDLKMPKMDGFELLAHVMEHYPEIPVIITTGHSIPESKKSELLSINVISKPFLLKDLNYKAKLLLERQADGGRLFNVSPGMFLQLIDMEAKTCTIRIEEKDSGKLGVLFFHQGKLYNARMNGLQGEEATQEIFSWDLISLSIQNDCAIHEKKINKTLNALILEATRLKDEKAEWTKTATLNNSGKKAQESPSSPMNYPPSTSNSSLTEPEISDRIRNSPQLKGALKSIQSADRWEALILELEEIGRWWNIGSLKAVGLGAGSPDDVVLLPGPMAIAVVIDAKCPKERIYSLLE